MNRVDDDRSLIVGNFNSKEETEESEKIDHAALLQEAFDALAKELEEKGNSDRLHELRSEYGSKLIGYWQAVATRCLKAGGLIIEGDERLTAGVGEVLYAGDGGLFESGNEAVLNVTRHTPMEDDEVWITGDEAVGVDGFMHPPKIKASIRSAPKEPPNLMYEVTLRQGGRISTFQRVRFVDDPSGGKIWVKDMRTLDFSVLRVDLL